MGLVIGCIADSGIIAAQSVISHTGSKEGYPAYGAQKNSDLEKVGIFASSRKKTRDKRVLL